MLVRNLHMTEVATNDEANVKKTKINILKPL